MESAVPEEKVTTMSVYPALTDEQEKEILRKCWYTHDARWFMSVAQEFGLEAANRLNRLTVRALGRTEGRRLLRAFGLSQVSSLEELVRLFDAGIRILVPPPAMEVKGKVIDERSYEISLGRCYVHENVVRAGIGEGYVCAVFDRVHGWHEAMNLPLAEELPALPCAKVQGRECRRVLTVQLPKA